MGIIHMQALDCFTDIYLAGGLCVADELSQDVRPEEGEDDVGG